MELENIRGDLENHIWQKDECVPKIHERLMRGSFPSNQDHEVEGLVLL